MSDIRSLALPRQTHRDNSDLVTTMVTDAELEEVIWSAEYRDLDPDENDDGFTGCVVECVSERFHTLFYKFLDSEESLGLFLAEQEYRKAQLCASESTVEARRRDVEIFARLAMQRRWVHFVSRRPCQPEPRVHRLLAHPTGIRCRARRTTRRAASSTSAREGPDAGDTDPPGSAWGRINTELTVHLQGLAGVSQPLVDATSSLGVVS